MVEKKVSLVKVRASIVAGKIASICGYSFGLLFFFGMLALVADGDAVDGVIVCFFLFLVCIFLIIRGIKIKKRIARFRRYTAFIYGENISSIKEIASSTSQTLDFVKKDLLIMIAKGFYTDLEVDMDDNKIIAGSRTAQAQATLQAKMDKFEKYSCPGCGASGIKPKGEQKLCEYCGNPIL